MSKEDKEDFDANKDFDKNKVLGCLVKTGMLATGMLAIGIGILLAIVIVVAMLVSV